ncbi:MAG: TonB-dependent receptor, partial [Gemmatimonadaceae bacterium]
MRDFRTAASSAVVITALGTAVVLGSLALAKCAGAQDTTRLSRGGYTVLVASSPVPAALSTIINIDADSVPLGALMQDIARRANVGIVYDRLLPGLTGRVTLHTANLSAAAVVLRALDGKSVDALVSPSGQIVLVRHVTRPGRLRVLVLDSAGTPVPSAFIELGSVPLVAVSAGDGAFSYPNIAPGEYSLRVRRLGFRPATSTVRVVGDDATVAPVLVTLEATPVPLTAVVVSPGYFGIMAQPVGSLQTLDREEIRTRPQLGDDLFRSINRLPGLSSDDFSAGFHVRGSEVDQMYVSFDGVQLIEPFHLKDLEGALSSLDVRSVDGIDLTTGGFTTEYGGRSGSLLTLHSLEPEATSTRTTLGLSITNLRVQSEGGFANGRGTWLVSGRRGYLDLALKLAGVDDSLSPVYSDVFAKVTWTLSDRNRLALHVLDAGDGLHYNDDQGFIKSSYGSRYAWLTWDTRPVDRLTGQTVLSASGLNWLRSGVPLSQNSSDEVHDERSYSDFAVRDDWTLSISDRAALKFGGEAHAMRASYDYLGLHTETTFANGTTTNTPLTVSANLTPGGSSLGAYVAPRVMLASWLTGELGARVDRVSYTGDALASPRGNLVANLTPTTSLRVSAGRYTQPQPIYTLQVGDGVTHFGSAEVDDQGAASIEQRLGDGVTVRVDAYDRRTVHERPRFINLRTSTEIFPEYAADRVLLPATSGQARGLELMARHSAAEGLEWTASYALASVTDDVDGKSLPRTYDQRHTAYIDASYRPDGARWRFSGAWQFHSGWPQAPVAFVVDTLAGT